MQLIKSQSKVLFAAADMENKEQNDLNNSDLQCSVYWPAKWPLSTEKNADLPE